MTFTKCEDVAFSQSISSRDAVDETATSRSLVKKTNGPRSSSRDRFDIERGVLFDERARWRALDGCLLNLYLTRRKTH